uniref:Uncharacterized protein n=1 Tax=Tetraselmis sp. GSL018 TaxID=582737 RepID=A0A061RN58_9CHLO
MLIATPSVGKVSSWQQGVPTWAESEVPNVSLSRCTRSMRCWQQRDGRCAGKQACFFGQRLSWKLSESGSGGTWLDDFLSCAQTGDEVQVFQSENVAYTPLMSRQCRICTYKSDFVARESKPDFDWMSCRG